MHSERFERDEEKRKFILQKIMSWPRFSSCSMSDPLFSTSSHLKLPSLSPAKHKKIDLFRLNKVLIISRSEYIYLLTYDEYYNRSNYVGCFGRRHCLPMSGD